MNALVTGASGFLGGALVKALVARGDTVRALVRPSSDLSHLAGVDVSMALGSLQDVESLKRALDGIDTVYHCAALCSDWGRWRDFEETNIIGTRNIVQVACKAKGLRRFVHVSTTDVYGYPSTSCDESHPLRDVGLPYNRSKIRAEQLCWEAHREQGLPVTVLRPATIYGPRSRSIVLELAMALRQGVMAFFGSGNTHAGLLYVDHAVDALIRASESQVTLGQAYNLRDPGEVTWKEFTDSLADQLGVPTPKLRVPAALAFCVAGGWEAVYRLLGVASRPLITRHAIYLFSRTQGYSIQKAERDFNFGRGIPLEEGLRRSVAWVREVMAK